MTSLSKLTTASPPHTPRRSTIRPPSAATSIPAFRDSTQFITFIQRTSTAHLRLISSTNAFDHLSPNQRERDTTTAVELRGLDAQEAKRHRHILLLMMKMRKYPTAPGYWLVGGQFFGDASPGRTRFCFWRNLFGIGRDFFATEGAFRVV